MTTALPNEILQEVHDALERNAFHHVDELLTELHPAEIATVLESLPNRQRDIVWESDSIDESEVLAYLNDAVRVDLIQDMDAEEVAAATEQMDADDAVDLLQDLPEGVIAEVLQAVDEQQRDRFTQILFYPEDSAGGLMNIDALTVRADLTLKIVMRYLRLKKELPEKTDVLMVVDRNNYYQGTLSLTDILTHEPAKTVAQVMQTTLEPVLVTESTQEVARVFEQRDLLSAPVVDENGLLLGRITIDDVVDVIRETADHVMMGRAGLDEEEDMFAPILSTTKQRAIWLGINLGTAFLAAWVIGLFSNALEQIVALAVLMPIVASMGGIAGSQTLTVVIRGMALGQVSATNAPWLLRKEIAVGILNGCLWALVVAGLAVLWFKSWSLGIIIGSALLINLFFAALAGMLIPLLLKRLSIDPALAGGVILTTVTDVIGFAAFLGLATLFLLNA
ncbi:magnesium transporter [Candidatus Albibeggiatoa sp. nov. NOAA]|uniref:magnesium transporter n=1 Tax=Candidatus Albibeggiatoa sp. nov. NOAA TaxID=3162724 RepID=UPI0032F0CAFB|nr:magnesium transporter [Thiotrichaceae bacterium]